ncbi:uncharacterized protein LOC143276897 [Babylonia areolata]|uniref:uncharacterized protein LOC143276897 n=1 Tax=Babylonia areolata TaxID=304850 RepID=UPI003FCFD0A6
MKMLGVFLVTSMIGISTSMIPPIQLSQQSQQILTIAATAISLEFNDVNGTELAEDLIWFAEAFISNSEMPGGLINTLPDAPTAGAAATLVPTTIPTPAEPESPGGAIQSAEEAQTTTSSAPTTTPTMSSTTQSNELQSAEAEAALSAEEAQEALSAEEAQEALSAEEAQEALSAEEAQEALSAEEAQSLEA